MEAEERHSKRRKLSSDGVSVIIETPETVTAKPGLDGSVQNTALESQLKPKSNDAVTSEKISNQLLHKDIDLNRPAGPNIDNPNDSSGADEDTASHLPESNQGDAKDITDTNTTANGSGSTATPLSKSAQKRLRKQLDWESKREDRKLIRKQKQIAKRERRKELRRAEQDQQQQGYENNGLDPIVDPDSLVARTSKSKPSEPEQRKHFQLPITVLIDCDFDNLMRDSERVSLAAQITRCYSDNRQALFRAHIGICSFSGHLKYRFDNVLSHYKGWRGVKFVEDDFVAAAEKAKDWMRDPKYGGNLTGTSSALAAFVAEEAPVSDSTKQEIADFESRQRDQLEAESEVVYLTSDAEETLTTLKPYSTYIIGGLVDKNREKGLCYKRARQRGVRTARLPIGEFLQMASRKILATNHVCEIILKWLESGDWGEALMKVMPKRKGGKLKDAEGEEDEDQAEPEEEDGNDEGAVAKEAHVANDGIDIAANAEMNAKGQSAVGNVEHEDKEEHL